MSQNDFTLANQSFPAFRADLNSALQALASNNSGTSAPSTTFANMWWYDSTNNIMYIRNEDNDAWIKFAELDQANDKFVLSGTLQLDDGTVSAPALTFNSDTNMGIYRGGTDILKFVTAGTDAVTIDANQNVGISTVPSTWSAFTGSLQIDGASFSGLGANNTALGSNAYYNGAWKYYGTGSASLYQQNAGEHRWDIAGSGTADNNTNFSTAMKIANNGDISFYEDTGTTAKMMWDSSTESLLIGNTTTNRPAEFSHPDGFAIRGDTVGQIQSTVTNATNALFNRDGTDGSIIELRKEGTTVGSIGTQGSRITIGDGAAGFRLHGTNGIIYPWNMSTNAINDNGIDLGSAGGRFKNLYLSGGIGGDSTISMSFSTGGNIGIGNTGPGYPLHVGTSSLDKRGMFTGSNQYRLGLQNGSSNVVWLGSGGADNFRISNSAGSTRFEIDSSGNGKFEGSGDCALSITANSTSNDSKIDFAHGSTVDGGITYDHNGSYASEKMAFRAGNNGTHMYLTGSGEILIGTSTSVNASFMTINATSGGAGKNNITLCTDSTGTSMSHLLFANPNGNVGSVTTSGTSTSYNTSSDHRLKENVTADWDATTRLKQLNPVRFNFIADADTIVDGFLAHEVQSVVPEAISGTHNEVEVWQDGEELPDGVSVGDNKLDEDGNTIPVYQGIDQSKLVPLLVKTIQELEARITALETA